MKSFLSEEGPDRDIVCAFLDFHSFQTHARLIEELKVVRPSFKLLSLSYFLSKYFEENNIEYETVEREKMTSEHKGLFESCEQYAQNWFLDGEQNLDFTQHKGLSLGSCMELYMFQFFQSAFSCAVDLEIYLKSRKPQLLVFFNPGLKKGVQLEGIIDFNIYQNLLPALCQNLGVKVLNVNISASCGKNKKLSGIFSPAPPISVFGKEIKLPLAIYTPLKHCYLIYKNIKSRFFYQPDKPDVFIASPTTFKYLGSSFIEKILNTKSSNLFIWLGESRQTAIRNILPELSFSFFFSKLRERKLRKYFKKRFEKDAQKIDQSTKFRNLSIFNLFPHIFEELYTRQFPSLICQSDLLTECLKKNRFKSVLVHSDHSIWEKIVLTVANSLSIPTIYIQHGLEGQPANTILGYPSAANHIFTWGEWDKRYKTSKGEPKEKNHLIGFPLHAFQDYSNPNDDLSLSSLGSFLFICNSGGQYRCDNRMTFLDNERQLKLVLECMKSFPNKTLVIKPRANDVQTGVYQKLINDLNVKNAVIVQTQIVELIKECDLYFNVFSTAGLEAIVFDKPGIQFLFTYDNKAPMIKNTGTEHIPFAKMGATLGLENPDPEKLTRLIQSIYESPEVREKMRLGRIQFLKEYANYGKGDPADLFLDALNKILSENIQNK